VPRGRENSDCRVKEGMLGYCSSYDSRMFESDIDNYG